MNIGHMICDGLVDQNEKFGALMDKQLDEAVKHNEYVEASMREMVKVMHQSVANQEVHAQRVDRIIDDFAIFHSKVLEKLDNLIEVTKESHSWRDGSGSGDDLVAGGGEYTDLGGEGKGK